ncbi:MAG: hypothetical protein IJD38_10450, partial [Clostridia bacterium]|nr:hypothetical protein [Clostridia bacterium]
RVSIFIKMDKTEGFAPEHAERHISLARSANFTPQVFHTPQGVFHSNLGLARSDKPKFDVWQNRYVSF